MSIEDLESIALAMVAPGKGIIAIDESTKHHRQALRRRSVSRTPRKTAAPIAKCC